MKENLIWKAIPLYIKSNPISFQLTNFVNLTIGKTFSQITICNEIRISLRRFLFKHIDFIASCFITRP